MKYFLNENWINDSTAIELPTGAVLLSDDDWNNRHALPDGITPPSPNYTQLRRKEYPSITDYIDGVVKGDQAQIDKYIADCLAVKAKYPKGVA
jgi:hypothetical protein